MSVTAFGLCMAIAAASAGPYPLPDDRVKLACDNAQTLIDAADKYDLDPFIMAGLVYVESRWTPDAVSRSNACGLTQVLPKYAPETCEQLKDPTTSLYAGSRALRKWSTIRKWDKEKKKYVRVPRKGGMKVSLACYNAGNACDKSSRGRAYSHKIRKISSWLKAWVKASPTKTDNVDGKHPRVTFIHPVLEESGVSEIMFYTPVHPVYTF